VDFWKRLRQLLGPEGSAKDSTFARAESAVQFGDRVRICSDPSTEQRGFVGKIGTVYGQTTPSVTNPEIIGKPARDYAVNVHFADLEQQFWFAEHLLELVDRNAGFTVSIKGIGKNWVRNADGDWDETPRP
jgi:ribosomal protein L21E